MSEGAAEIYDPSFLKSSIAHFLFVCSSPIARLSLLVLVLLRTRDCHI